MMQFALYLYNNNRIRGTVNHRFQAQYHLGPVCYVMI